MKIIGITGGVGAGKTQILEYLNNTIITFNFLRKAAYYAKHP